jgi:hypothetical protein
MVKIYNVSLAGAAGATGVVTCPLLFSQNLLSLYHQEVYRQWPGMRNAEVPLLQIFTQDE